MSLGKKKKVRTPNSLILKSSLGSCGPKLTWSKNRGGSGDSGDIEGDSGNKSRETSVKNLGVGNEGNQVL